MTTQMDQAVPTHIDQIQQLDDEEMVVDNAQASSKGETAMSKDDSETPVDQPWEKFGGSEEGSTDGDLMCSVCLEMLWDPIVLPCGHRFCRCCILQISRRSADGGKCPNCRANVAPVNPANHPVDEELGVRIKESMSGEEIETRGAAAGAEMERLLTVATRSLPVFAMRPGCRPGQNISLHLFEPRYREMVRRVMATEDHLFIFASSSPEEGKRGTVVELEGATRVQNGSYDIRGTALETVELQQVWVEPDTGGLHYANVHLQHPSLPPLQPDLPRQDAVSRDALREEWRALLQSVIFEGSSASLLNEDSGRGGGSGSNVRAFIPVFYMRGGAPSVGGRVSLNLFEPRYRALAVGSSATHKLFIYALGEPGVGVRGVVVRMSRCEFRNNGNASIVGRGVEEVVMERVESTPLGLIFAKCRLTAASAVAAYEPYVGDGGMSGFEPGGEGSRGGLRRGRSDGSSGGGGGSGSGRKSRCAVM